MSTNNSPTGKFSPDMSGLEVVEVVPTEDESRLISASERIRPERQFDMNGWIEVGEILLEIRKRYGSAGMLDVARKVGIADQAALFAEDIASWREHILEMKDTHPKTDFDSFENVFKWICKFSLEETANLEGHVFRFVHNKQKDEE